MQMIDSRKDCNGSQNHLLHVIYACTPLLQVFTKTYNAPVKTGLTTLGIPLHPASAHLYKDTILTHAAIIEDS